MKLNWLVLIACALPSGPLLACSCPESPDLPALHDSAEVAFSGVVTSTRPWLIQRAYRFGELTFYKGGGSDVIKIWSFRNTMSCAGTTFVPRARYVVFAERDGRKLRVSGCSSWPIEFYPKELERFYPSTSIP